MLAWTRILTAVVTAGLLSSASTVLAQDSSPVEPAPAAVADSAQTQVDELRRQVEILAQEVEKLRAGDEAVIEISDERRRALGLAPSAAAAYRRANQGVSFAGYGEMLLENFAGDNESGAGNAPTTRLDFLRAVIYTGYRFNDRFLFNSEIEVEHGNEIFVELAYVDFLVNQHLTLRGGLLLVPLGLVNEFHEPNVFLGAKRPETEQRILPTTWRENGAGVLGSAGPVSYRVYFVNGLNGSGFTSAGVRGGRQRGIQARAANMAVAGRVDVTMLPGVFAGVGMYRGGSGQDTIVVNGERLDINNTVTELHGQAQFRGFDLRALYARSWVDDAGALSRALNLAVTAPVGERMQGGYVQAGYNVVSQTSATIGLMPYIRLEHVDTQDRVPVGFTRDRSRDGMFTTLGFEIKPVPQIALKTEYQWIRNEAGTGRNQFNLNLGYAF